MKNWPCLAPDQFSVAQPLGPEDLDRPVMRHSVYPSFLAPTGVPWSEFIRSQRNRSRSASSFTEALDSDHARYITSQIAQNAKSMTTGTRSLPTDSPVPYFQPIERGHMSEGVPSDIDSLRAVPHGGMQMPPHHANLSETPYIPPGGIDYHPVVLETDRLSTYTALDDYDTLFEARHGRGVLDHMPRTSGEVIATSSIGMSPMTFGVGVIENSLVRIRPIPDSGLPSTNQKGYVTRSADPSWWGIELYPQ